MRAALFSLETTVAAVGRECRAVRLTGPRARESYKTVVSVLLALAVSLSLLEVEDAYWVAFSAFMVMRAAPGETTQRALLRITGTLAGGAVGFLLAPFTANDPLFMMLAMMGFGFVAIFQFQVSRDSYSWMWFGMTGLLVVTSTLATPGTVVPFVAIRIAEITIGSICCVLAVSVFAVLWPIPEPLASPEPAVTPNWWGFFEEERLYANWPHLSQAARGALALGLLAVAWRVIELQDFIGTAVTSFMVMLVPAAPIRAGRDSAVRDRGMHRLVGCVFGGCAALTFLLVVQDSLTLWALAIAVGVWVGAWIQNGTEGVGYAGSQFALCFLVTLVQGNPAPNNILAPLERLEGVLIGLAALGIVNAAWPLASAPVVVTKRSG